MTHEGLNIVVPASDLPIQEVGLKDVPAGVAFKIVDIADIPTDRTYRAAWEADMSNPDGYGIGSEAWFAQQKEKEELNDNN